MSSKSELISSTGNKTTINHIFSDNNNWNRYHLANRNSIRDVEREEVEKMLACRDSSRGYFICQCHNCREVALVRFGCNSRLCTHCGTKFNNDWADKIAAMTFDVPHRHIIFTMPDMLWHLFREDRTLLKDLLDCSIRTLNNVLKEHLGRELKAGAIVVLHTYGKDMKWNPHLHVIATDGGFDKIGNFHSRGGYPFVPLRACWMYEVLTMLRERKQDESIIQACWDKYEKKLFYVRAKDKIKKKWVMAKYIGRYVRHPAIAESRIDDYDGNYMTFYWVDDKDVTHYETWLVDKFIGAIIGHIPDRHFKVVRHYGVYSRNQRRKFAKLRGLSSIQQEKLTVYTTKRAILCPKCDSAMEIIWYQAGEPPPDWIFGEKIAHWC